LLKNNMNIKKSLGTFLINFPSKITPRFVEERADPERLSIDRFVKNEVAPNVKKDALVLDAGAGTRYFSNFFKHTRYVSTDFENVFDENSRDIHDFVCDLADIPKEDNTYDVILNTQVLEHVPDPQKVANELFRVLKPGGNLYVTVPQMWMVHGAPYNYFFFTRYGLEEMFTKAGFTIKKIEARGGAFWFMTKFTSVLGSYILYQHIFTGYKKGVGFKPKFKGTVTAYLLLPFLPIVQLIFGYWIPFLLYYLDFLDKQQDFTLGYQCVCQKPESTTVK